MRLRRLPKVECVDFRDLYPCQYHAKSTYMYMISVPPNPILISPILNAIKEPKSSNHSHNLYMIHPNGKLTKPQPGEWRNVINRPLLLAAIRLWRAGHDGTQVGAAGFRCHMCLVCSARGVIRSDCLRLVLCRGVVFLRAAGDPR